TDASFIFTETTANLQDISIQGSFTSRISDPVAIAQVLDFTVVPRSLIYRSDDPIKLTQRIVNAVQAHTRTHVSAMPLEAALTDVGPLASEVLAHVVNETDLAELGVIVESLHFTSVRATPEIQKALETEYREGLQKNADQAIYARRAAAVAEERKIQESELNTEVELETRRRELVDMQARNKLALAEAEAKAEELKLSPYGALPPQALIGLALKDWAANAGSIDNLSITPDMLSKLVGWMTTDTRPADREAG
ncbi:MAG: SPFH domain-containing protein, partial [Hyphomicrobiales bacterium]